MNDLQQIEQLVHDYILTIRDGNLARFDQIWDHSAESCLIAPSGQYNGYSSIKQDFLVGVMEQNLSDRDLRTKDLAIHIFGDFAYTVFYWEIHAIRKADGSAHIAEGKETQILRRFSDGWKLVHIHYSGLALPQ